MIASELLIGITKPQLLFDTNSAAPVFSEIINGHPDEHACKVTVAKPSSKLGNIKTFESFKNIFISFWDFAP